MKICLATRAPFIGGAEVAAERLALGLIEAGHDVVVLLARSGEVHDRYVAAGLRCVVLPLCTTDRNRFWRYLWSSWRLASWLRRERFSLIHANDLPTHQMVARAARRVGLPRLCHHRFPFDGPTIDWLNKYGAERHVFVSHALMDDMCARSSRLCASPRAVVHDGLPLPTLPSADERGHLRHRLSLADDRVIVLYAGQIIERKGIADLLHAWASLPATPGELHLLGDDLQGQGSYRLAMEELARSLHVHIRFHGFRPDVADWLRAADVAVVPSHVEPLGNATLEAMAHALPVIGTHVGGIPEMILTEETGLLVPPHSPPALAAALRRLIADADLRVRLGTSARRRCESQFSLQAHVNAMRAQYELCRAGPRGT